MTNYVLLSVISECQHPKVILGAEYAPFNFFTDLNLMFLSDVLNHKDAKFYFTGDHCLLRHWQQNAPQLTRYKF